MEKWRLNYESLHENGIDTSKIVVSGPSVGAHLASILCYSKKVQEEYGIGQVFSLDRRIVKSMMD